MSLGDKEKRPRNRLPSAAIQDMKNWVSQHADDPYGFKLLLLINLRYPSYAIRAEFAEVLNL